MTDEGPDVPRRRRRDTFYGRVEWVWQNGVPFIAIVLAAIAVRGNTSDIQRQREGRRVAVDVTCATMSAVIDAGRATITGSSRVSPKFERNLQRLGYPPRKQRQAAAKAAAAAYAESIARTVEREAGVEGLVQRDGTLNCARLRAATKTQNP